LRYYTNPAEQRYIIRILFIGTTNGITYYKKVGSQVK
jgi:hypothetical protein